MYISYDAQVRLGVRVWGLGTRVMLGGPIGGCIDALRRDLEGIYYIRDFKFVPLMFVTLGKYLY